MTVKVVDVKYEPKEERQSTWYKIKVLLVLMIFGIILGHIYLRILGNNTYKDVLIYNITYYSDKNAIVSTSIGNFDYIKIKNIDQRDNEYHMRHGGKCELVTKGVRNTFFATRPNIIKIRCVSIYTAPIDVKRERMRGNVYEVTPKRYHEGEVISEVKVETDAEK